MPTIGALRRRLPVDPWKLALPKLNTPPSDPTSQYPPPPGVAAMPTIGSLRCWPPMEPRKGAVGPVPAPAGRAIVGALHVPPVSVKVRAAFLPEFVLLR